MLCVGMRARDYVFFHKLDETCIFPLAASAFCVNKDVLRLLGSERTRKMPLSWFSHFLEIAGTG